MQGYLKIFERDKEGNRSLVYEDKNIVTEGFGYNLVNLFLGTSHDIENFKIKYFRVGRGIINHNNNPAFYNLQQPWPGTSFEENTNVNLVTHNMLALTGAFTVASAFATSTSIDFGTIENYNITNFNGSAIEFYFSIDENTLVNKQFREVGLFAANPDGEGVKKSVMVCYRSLGAVVLKNDFAYDFYWTLAIT